LSLLEVCPRLLLIGIQPASDQVLVWSGKNLSSLSTQELVQTITGNDPGLPTPKPAIL
jgi:hypothetical protein